MRIYAAPAASLLAVTAAVLAVHYGVQHTKTVPRVATVTHLVKAKRPHKHHSVIGARTYVVQRGDSFSAIAVKTHTSVSQLERLNPGLSPTALRVGETVKVK